MALRKALIGCSVAFAAVIGAALYSIANFGDGMCGNDIVQNVVAPDGSVKAVIFERDCGATTNFSTQVSVIGSQATLPNSAGNVFVGDGNAVATGPKGTIPIHVSWTNAKHLQIWYPVQASIHQKSSFILVGLGWFRSTLIHVYYSATPSPRTT